MIVTAKDGDKNMLRTEVWKEIRLLDDYIQNMTVFFDDQYFQYKDICAKWSTECFQNDILNLDQIMDQVSTYIYSVLKFGVGTESFFHVSADPLSSLMKNMNLLYFMGKHLKQNKNIESLVNITVVYINLLVFRFPNL